MNSWVQQVDGDRLLIILGQRSGSVADRLLNLMGLVSSGLTLEAATILFREVAVLSLVNSKLLRGTLISVVATLVVVLLLGASLVSHTSHELLDDVGNLVHVSGVNWAMTAFLEVALELLLFLVFFVLEVAVQLDLVVVNVKELSVHIEVLVVLGGLGLIRRLVANNCVGALAVFFFENAACLDFSELAEHVYEILLGLVLETFDVEVTSFLGGFVLEGLVFKFFAAFSLLEGGFHVEVLAFVFLAVEQFDSLLGTTVSIFIVVFVR